MIRQWRADTFELVLSKEILDEYEVVLMRPKFALPEWVVQELLSYMEERAIWIGATPVAVAAARDPSDDKFLEAAVAGGADWIVSGDKDLLDIGEFEGIPIISPREFLGLL